jgi:uncharacterized protein (TIGR04255 family)
MTELFNIPAQTRRTFRRHFLTSVHAEVRYAGVAMKSVLESKDAFSSELKGRDLGNVNDIQQGSMSINQIPGQIPVIQQSSGVIGLSFSSSHQKQEIQILGDRLVISNYSYQGFETFRENFCQILNLVENILSFERNIIQVGLRKINQVRIGPVHSILDAANTFNPHIFSSLSAGFCSNNSFIATQNSIVLELGTKLAVLQSSLKRGDVNHSYEASLDFDLTEKTQHGSKQQVIEALESLNTKHFDLFIWAASEKILKAMEAE